MDGVDVPLADDEVLGESVCVPELLEVGDKDAVPEGDAVPDTELELDGEPVNVADSELLKDVELLALELGE